MKAAIQIEKRQGRFGNKPLKDALAAVIAEYNRMITVRSHRVDTDKKKVIYNLPLGTFNCSAVVLYVSCFTRVWVCQVEGPR